LEVQIMSTQQHVHGNRPLSALLSGLARLVYDHVIDSVRRQARSRTGELELARLDDRTLCDIGLTRSEIHAAACGLLGGDRASGSASQDMAGDQPVPATPAKAAALVRELSDHLLHASTATEALHTWCAARGLSAGPITALKRNPDQRRYPDDDMLDELRPERHERIAYRCVRLVRGQVVLSEADNWFIPDRLPPEVRDLLEATDVPFGAAVARLQPSRRTYFVRFAELSAAGEVGTGGSPAGLSPSMPILEHKAVVLDRNRQPLSVVSERYCAALLGSVAFSGRR
jgi:uncharacterized protein YjiS (DUF1127 family)/chorismate-pyruvate lyase